jgi:hypothetical protein
LGTPIFMIGLRAWPRGMPAYAHAGPENCKYSFKEDPLWQNIVNNVLNAQ